MTIEELENKIRDLKEFIGDENWEEFKKQPILIHLPTGVDDIELTALCGSHYTYGGEALIQGKF